MSGNLYYTPGQTVTFYQEVINSQQQLVDDGYTPVVTRIIDPTLVSLSGFPQNMTRLDIGVYSFQFKAPSTIGTYLVDIVYQDPDTSLLVNDFRQVIIYTPLGRFGLINTAGFYGRTC